MNLVLDVSAAVGFVLRRDGTNSYAQLLAEADSVFVPELFAFEATNVFWKLQKAKALPLTTCEKLLQKALELPDEFVSGSFLSSTSLKLAAQLEHSAYDMFYLALSIQENAGLLTLDQSLKKLATRFKIQTY